MMYSDWLTWRKPSVSHSSVHSSDSLSLPPTTHPKTALNDRRYAIERTAKRSIKEEENSHTGAPGAELPRAASLPCVLVCAGLG